MKVCFIVPPNPTAIEDRIDPHLGLLSIAAVVREKGYEVEYVEWEMNLTFPPPADVYGVTAYGINYQMAVDIGKACKAFFPESKVIVGGPIASILPQRCLEDFDAVCIGEGEGAFLEFLNLGKTGRFYFGHNVPYVQGRTPPPAYDLADWSMYSRLVMGQRAFGLVTSRGCPYNCAFCQNDRKWDRFRKQPHYAVARDVRYCKEVTGFKAATFWDNSFELRIDYEFLDMIGQEDIIFSYQARGAVHKWNEEIYQAGGRVVFIGLETGDPDLLRQMNKGLTLDQIKAAVHQVQEAGILARCGILFGFPGETPQTLERTRKFVEEVKPDQTFLTFFAPFPGTDVWRNPAKYGVTWMAPWDQQRFQGKEGWVEASIETPWMSREEWNRQAVEMAEWWRSLPRRKDADHSWWRDDERP
jgi:radical SAM superfamily enzyme YgiQ (UPF0313 family)